MSKSVQSGDVCRKKTAACRGKGVSLATKSDPGEKIGYQLANCRIEGDFFCLESGGSGHSLSPPPPSKTAVRASTRGRSAASLPKGTCTSRLNLQSGPPLYSSGGGGGYSHRP